MIKYKIIDLLFFPLYLISCVIPKNYKIWVFGEYSGNTFADNPKYLYLHINQRNKNIRAVWLTRKKQIVSEIRSLGFEAYYAYSPLGVYYAMRAGVAICCVDMACDFIGCLFSSKTFYVNLWHGTPLKKIGQDIVSGNFRVSKFKSIIKSLLHFLKMRRKHPADLFICSSALVSKSLQSAFALSENEVAITGYPRNDALFAVADENSGRKKIIYMPTFRGKIGEIVDFFTSYGFDIDLFEEVLSGCNAELWIRLHRYNQPNQAMLERIERSQYIHMYQKSDIYEDLSKFEILITDFSSVYFDFLLLNKPIIFAAFDFDNYINKDREIYYNYDIVTPGPKADNWSEVLSLLKKSLQNPQEFSAEREAICDTFNLYKDNKSSDRVFNSIIRLLNKV
jgi:CDP-glycerol glycerophosphotransferase